MQEHDYLRREVSVQGEFTKGRELQVYRSLCNSFRGFPNKRSTPCDLHSPFRQLRGGCLRPCVSAEFIPKL